MVPQDHSIFTLLDPEFYSPLEQRTPGSGYSAKVSERLDPKTWSMQPGGVWTYAHPRDWNGPAQGWKLHVSAEPANASAVLQRVAQVMVEQRAAFKFASDPWMLHVMLSKNWPREGGGKFITIYPADEDHFKRIGRAVAEATGELDGPYILSDRRVPGSRIVFYRYGQHQPMGVLDARGNRAQHMVTPLGEKVPDSRTSYYHLPEWVGDPFGARPVRVVGSGEKKIKLQDRYEVDHPLKFSNTGGVYRGTDLQEDRKIVIREARPRLGWAGSTDSVGLLQKEARILRSLDGTGWTPRYVDCFQVWEHHYLVQELVDGMPLRNYVLHRYLRPNKIASPRRLFWTFRHLITELLRGVEEFHRRGIILRDLTSTNVLVRRDSTVCFIDLEFAWERDGQDSYAVGIHSPGFASPEQVGGAAPTEADDLHSLGAMVVEMCSMMASGLGLNRVGVLASMRMMMDEIGLPRELFEVAAGLLDPDPSRRLRGDGVRQVLWSVPSSSVPWTPREPGRGRPLGPESVPPPSIYASIAEVCERVCEFFEASHSFNGKCLWPASPHAYSANPVCIQFGACGPIELVRRVRGECPAGWLDWVEQRATPDRCPPGLYVGLSGVALTLAACGREESARRLLKTAAQSPLLETESDLYHGAAGVGTAALALGTSMEDQDLHDIAARIGEQLARRAEHRARGIALRDASGQLACGLAQGGSGIALFFTYLGACTGETRHWEWAKQLLEFEFSQARQNSGYHLWPANGGTRKKRSNSPHTFYGSAGVGTAALRLLACTGDPELREWAERCATATAFRWTNKLWQDFGYAGYGELLLDMHTVTGDSVYSDHAVRMAEVLLANQVTTRFGVAFPGGGALNRVTSDFGMGTSGIALFLRRLLDAQNQRAFFPDHLLPGWSSEREAPTGMAVGTH